jgi:RHH-type proline utilization regulon transcriptional repressor/proline dehydrogenase/delta 1-pyrroline-5-carboxylate dehydrogenase
MIFAGKPPPADNLRAAIRAKTLADERACVAALVEEATLLPDSQARIAESARRLVAEARRRRGEEGALGQGGIDAFLREYALSSQEGVVLMCLAEALLRIPDAETADRLIRDKLAAADWERHLGQSDSLFVNASTWALMLTGRLVSLEEIRGHDLRTVIGRIVARSGEPVVRQAITGAMRILGRQFVMGRTIEEAMERAVESEAKGYRYSYDMLGEAARTARDAERYFQAYDSAIAAIGERAGNQGVIAGPGISVKLSALHPRCEFWQRERAVPEIAVRLRALALAAAKAGISLTVDAEEADRLELSLDILEAVAADPALEGWDGLGLAVQAYQKRAPALVDWLVALARRHGRRLMVRLVKGAYWDAEIKRAQERGLDGYPVFTRKAHTDVSYLACARRVLAASDALVPQFATHNAHTLAAVLEMAGKRRDLEFQRLHGMGEALYDQVAGNGSDALPCRVYAPVGSHEDLLPYLVRRLLENGANTSFVNRITDEALPIEDVVADPVAKVRAYKCAPHPRIPLPADLFGAERRNARGLDLTDPATLEVLAARMEEADALEHTAVPIVAGEERAGAVAGDGGSGRVSRAVMNPADHRRTVGEVVEAGPQDRLDAVAAARAAAPAWDATPAQERAACLEWAAALMEENAPLLMTLCVREAGRTVPAAHAEVREAVDFCRYYAARARADFARAEDLPGPTGESNRLALHGRGVFACISPWNFPLSIFTGQVAAALAAGNAVVAKPAQQTPLVAAVAVRLLHQAGVPAEVLHLLPGGAEVGAPLVADPRIAGVAFTGSTETARAINQALASRPGPIAPLIAETGGQNAMIVDSSALPEQVVVDALASAFDSAGQRCSALRVLFVQDDVAPRLLDMLCGAMAELVVGDPAMLSTDVGPVIDAAAKKALEEHGERMSREGKLLYQLRLPPEAEHGTFFAPMSLEIERLGLLTREVFGPILHVLRFEAERLDDVIEAINATGYGLTLGIHSRIDATVDYIHQRLAVGNTYVNRNMIGAVVGVQPFGGERLSGTGPKAGGARYLERFATERALSVNTAATGGNAALLSLAEEGPEEAPPARPPQS